MRVVVLGAGVIGVTSAWYLAKAGLEVELVDRQALPGLETSFANGGQLTAGSSQAWASPATLRRLLAGLAGARAGMPARLVLDRQLRDPTLWLWLARFLLNCTTPRARLHGERILRLALYSRSCLQALRREVSLDIDQQDSGVLHFYRDAALFDQAAAGLEASQRLGLNRRRLSASEAVALEPALAALGPALRGGIFSPDDGSGDAHQFTRQLAAEALQRGVRWRPSCVAHHLEGDARGVTGVATSQGRLRADIYVLATGCWTARLARQVGVALPITPAQGHSVTFPLTDASLAPRVGLSDSENALVFSRLGSRLRVAGTVTLAGWSNRPSPAHFAALQAAAGALFPGAFDGAKAETWSGLRPLTPDQVPIIGGTRIGNLFINSGHGSLGWTLACGAGKLLADIVCRRPADIDLKGLDAARFSF